MAAPTGVTSIKNNGDGLAIMYFLWLTPKSRDFKGSATFIQPKIKQNVSHFIAKSAFITIISCAAFEYHSILASFVYNQYSISVSEHK